MFPLGTTTPTLPSLTFTKAELVYALAVLMADIPANDNQTRLELVEIRHYLNQIKDKVQQAVSDGTLERAMPIPGDGAGKDTPPNPKPAPMPSMSELRAKFPTLSEKEIREVLENAKKERLNESSSKKEPIDDASPPPYSSFIAKPKPKATATDSAQSPKFSPPPLSKSEEKQRENSRKFAEMLGQM